MKPRVRSFTIGALGASGMALAVTLLVPGPISAREDGTSATPSGHELFINECGMCHVEGGTGTFMLERRLGASKALLAQRGNLQPVYVEFVVRNGLNSMPPMSRVEVTDEELTKIARYLAQEDGDRHD